MIDKTWITKKIISHRGEEYGNVIENTSESFEHAISKNMIIEMDVLLTKDNQLIVFHDANAQRLLGVNKRIKNMTLDEIQSLSLPNGDKVMTLEQALSKINHRTEVIVDIKPQISISDSRVVNSFNEVINKYHKEGTADLSVQSFNPFLLKKIKKNNPELLIGQLAFLVEDFIFSAFLKPDYLSVNVKMFNFFHKLRKKKDLPIIGWNVQEKNFLHSLTNFDNLIIDLEHHSDNSFKELKSGLSEIKNILKNFDVKKLKNLKENYKKFHNEGYLEKLFDMFKFHKDKNFITIDGSKINHECIFSEKILLEKLSNVINVIEKFSDLIHAKDNIASIRKKTNIAENAENKMII